MKGKVDIKIRQLIEMQKEKGVAGQRKIDLETLLLNGPVATKKQLKIIAANRKAIAQWRRK
jgi:hypothetical protein